MKRDPRNLVTRTFVTCAALLLMLSAPAAPAAAGPNSGPEYSAMGPINSGAGWVTFYWDGPTLPVAIDENPFTFTCDAGCTVRVTDTYVCGDVFDVYDGATLLGSTSAPDCTGDPSESDPDVTFAGSQYSHGSFALGPGSHSINLQLTSGVQSGNYSGAAFISVLGAASAALPADVPVNSPAALAALVVLLGVAAFVALRRF